MESSDDIEPRQPRGVTTSGPIQRGPDIGDSGNHHRGREEQAPAREACSHRREKESSGSQVRDAKDSRSRAIVNEQQKSQHSREEKDDCDQNAGCFHVRFLRPITRLGYFRGRGEVYDEILAKPYSSSTRSLRSSHSAYSRVGVERRSQVGLVV